MLFFFIFQIFSRFSGQYSSSFLKKFLQIFRYFQVFLKDGPRFFWGGGNAKITQISKSNFSGLRGRMEVGVGAFERYGVLGCAWGTWSVFQALAHIRHAFENFWSKMAKILAQWTRVCLVGATPFRSGPTPKMCQAANYLANAPYYALIRPLDRIL